MKRYSWIACLLLLPCIVVQAQSKEEKKVEAAVELFRKGIVDADRSILDHIAAEELVYGHSNGKVQDKVAFINEIVSGIPLDYVTVDISEQTIKIAGDIAIVRHVFSSQTKADGKDGNLKIGNMLIWQKQKGQWKLIARQAYKL